MADFYIGLHSHQYGTTTYPFYYEPTTELPFPDSRKIIERFGIDFEPEKEERFELCYDMGTEEIPVLPAEEVGCDVEPEDSWWLTDDEK